jgi:alkanesulfonate monooxygenase SsuD/methylene tetrahydromethanopterin reductase-like flavin-dependent oxidoreductase (luciferase family)
VQRPGVPIHVGGHVPAAARRAARLGDGFFPARADRLPELLRELRAECARIGRDPSEIEVTAGAAPTLDEAKRLRDLGVARFVVPPPASAPDALRKGLERIGDEILARL